MSSLSCGLNLNGTVDDEELRFQQTFVSLQLTQTAVANPPKTEPEISPTQSLPTTPNSTITQVPPDILFEGISFSFDQSISLNINATIIPGQNLGEEHMPGDTYPSYIEFSFDRYAVSDHFHEPKISIYPIEEYRIINDNAANIIDKLQQTLINKPAGSALSNLPFLPMWPAAQMFSAKVEYIDFQNGSGLRYLTMFGQAVYPIDNKNLFYTYQGITDDGLYYISAILPVINAGLPNDGTDQLEDYEAFINNWDNYLAENLIWLESQESQSFLPNLDELDAMITSFNINR